MLIMPIKKKKKPWPRRFIAASFIIAATWKRHKCPSGVEWKINCGVFIQWNAPQQWKKKKKKTARICSHMDNSPTHYGE